MAALLDRIEKPSDIRNLSMQELRELCAEIRAHIVECCSKNPGHLASSLGAVELIVGYHYVFDPEDDRIVFDVGHQAYAHKILTGRREALRTMRSEGGISGFPNRSESPYDVFGAGHSSTSISAALGLAEAARIQGRSGKVVALIGDGAMTGGLAFEGINNAGASKADLLIILNDNNQSISGNTGALHESLLKITSSRPYNRVKNKVWDMMGDREARNFLQRWIKGLKSWFVKKSGGDVFESLGFRYFGPVDGNDIEDVVSALSRLRDLKGPRILHCMTVKGKGYAPSEADPVTWHAPGKFDPQTGKRTSSASGPDRYQDVFGEVLCELAALDPKVVGITPAMALGSGMTRFAAEYPDRFFDVGIEEEHAVTFSAGLAAGGMKPFCNIYSSFSQRAYDQIIHDVALQGLPVTLCFDRAGLVGEDGATHHGMFDLSAYRSVPGITIASPKDETELRMLMYTAYMNLNGPFIIRYPRGRGEGTPWRDEPLRELPVGKAEKLLDGTEAAIIAIGPPVERALKAAQDFAGKVAVYNFRFLKPLDEETLSEIAGKFSTVLTVEDGALKGGLFGAVSEYMSSCGNAVRVIGLGAPDRFIPQASQAGQWAECGIDVEGIRKSLQKVFG